VKLPRFPFDKFPTADRSLGSQMKATGEVMAIDRTFGAALNKALRGLEQAGAGFLAEDPAWTPTLDVLSGPVRGPGERPGSLRREDLSGEVFVGEDGLVCADRTNAIAASRPILLKRFLAPSDSRLWRLLALLRRGVPATELQAATGMAPWFVGEMERLVDVAQRMREEGRALSDGLLVSAKRAAFGDRDIATLTGLTTAEVAGRRLAAGLKPGFAMVDTCAAEFAAETPYFYATYAATGSPPEAAPVKRPAALVIGSGPVRIGQGIEFDYCAVQAAATLREDGWNAVMVNSNPETVSTDFDASSRLYFEPLDPESVLAVIEAESQPGEPMLPALVQFGGQTPLNLAEPLVAAGVTLPGLTMETIELAEERTRFAGLVERLGIPQPEGGIATSLEEALVVAERVGYPVIMRPSFVIGGLAAYVMSPVADRFQERWRLSRAVAVALLYLLVLVPIAALAVLFGPRLLEETRLLIVRAPELLTGLIADLFGPGPYALLGGTVDSAQISRDAIDSLRGAIGSAGQALRFAVVIAELALNVFLALIVSVYLLADSQRVTRLLIGLVPQDRRARVAEVSAEVHRTLARYLRRLGLLTALVATVIFLGLELIFHLHYALPLAVATGMLEIVPFIGPVAAGSIAAMIAVTQGGSSLAVGVIVFYFVVRQIQDQLVGPIVLGSAVELHPVIIIFAVLAGGTLFGILGTLAAVPAAASIKVILDYWPQLFPSSDTPTEPSPDLADGGPPES
jgi:predicted PurR-regulated permease PerM